MRTRLVACGALGTLLALSACGNVTDEVATTGAIDTTAVDSTAADTTPTTEASTTTTVVSDVVPNAAEVLEVRTCYVVEEGFVVVTPCEQLHEGQIFRNGVTLDGVHPTEADAAAWTAAAKLACEEDFHLFTDIDLESENPTRTVGVVLEPGSQDVAVVSCAVVDPTGASFAGTAEMIAGSYEAIDVGECFDFPDALRVAAVKACDEPHEGEMFVVDAPLGLDEDDAPYPTDAEWQTLAEEICTPAFGEYTGTSIDDQADLSYSIIYPGAAEWEDVAARTMSCAIVSADGTLLTSAHQA
jgi:hypothetical protein